MVAKLNYNGRSLLIAAFQNRNRRNAYGEKRRIRPRRIFLVAMRKQMMRNFLVVMVTVQPQAAGSRGALNAMPLRRGSLLR